MTKAKIKKLCFMCEKRPVKKLTATRDGDYYVNAQDIEMFCSFKCAANYGLLWGAPAIEQSQHFCPKTNKWEMCAEYECDQCKETNDEDA